MGQTLGIGDVKQVFGLFISKDGAFKGSLQPTFLSSLERIVYGGISVTTDETLGECSAYPFAAAQEDSVCLVRIWVPRKGRGKEEREKEKERKNREGKDSLILSLSAYACVRVSDAGL